HLRLDQPHATRRSKVNSAFNGNFLSPPLPHVLDRQKFWIDCAENHLAVRQDKVELFFAVLNQIERTGDYERGRLRSSPLNSLDFLNLLFAQLKLVLWPF